MGNEQAAEERTAGLQHAQPDRSWIESFLTEQVKNCQSNYVPASLALRADLIGLTIFALPLVGVTGAQNPLFTRYKEANIIGPHHRTPLEWLLEAKSVVSFFLPFSEKVRSSNRYHKTDPSPEWLHARIEGQSFISNLSQQLAEELTIAGYPSVAPANDRAFFAMQDQQIEAGCLHYTSNWSERHVAYACGLGTFGLSRGIITEKGMAGRLGSIVTSLDLAATEPTSDPEPYANCIQCRACIERCPAQAISMEAGKQHQPCAAFVEKMRQKYSPRYGCGKCQVAVPCEFCNPAHD